MVTIIIVIQIAHYVVWSSPFYIDIICSKFGKVVSRSFFKIWHTPMLRWTCPLFGLMTFYFYNIAAPSITWTLCADMLFGWTNHCIKPQHFSSQYQLSLVLMVNCERRFFPQIQNSAPQWEKINWITNELPDCLLNIYFLYDSYMEK